ncbi:MAG: Gfo/Idh/MocA family oxidoreductase [Planctomycetaceae bacterium]|nr:Gfo/Idh/MocA family oxidoreductase [Planctomycetaceae bacterium]
MIHGWVLVAGYGSIGRRHFRNLQALGCSDVRLLRGRARAGSFESPDNAKVYTDLSQALADKPVAVIVANPTSLHVSVAVAALQAGAHVVLEKPVAADLQAAAALVDAARTSRGHCSMAYCFRYHPLYRKVHDVVTSGRIGRAFHAHTWQGSFLPSWHPWEDYHESYAARSDMGGGVIRTLDHDLDVLRWTLGQPESVLASGGALSGIGISAEDTADMIFRFPQRVQACAHLSFARQDYCRGMWVVGEEGSVNLDWNARSVTVFKGKEPDETLQLPADFDLNTIYIEMLRDALAGFAASPPRAAIELTEGLASLEMALGALQSSREGRAVTLKGA